MIFKIPKTVQKIYGTIIYEGHKDIGENKIRNAGQVLEFNKEQNLWRAARPVGYYGFIYKLRCAWLVVREKADIVIWND